MIYVEISILLGKSNLYLIIKFKKGIDLFTSEFNYCLNPGRV